MKGKRLVWPGRIIDRVMASLFARPATVRYPVEPLPMPPSYRGTLLFDASLCTGCKLCVRDCPAEAITIRRIGEERRFEAVVDLGRCLICGQCVDLCAPKALRTSPTVELAALGREQLVVLFPAGSSASPTGALPLPSSPAPPPADGKKEGSS